MLNEEQKHIQCKTKNVEEKTSLKIKEEYRIKSVENVEFSLSSKSMSVIFPTRT